MLKVTTTAEVTYTCFLTDDKEQKVRNYAEKHGLSLKQALSKMYFSDGFHELDLYEGSTESDFATNEIVDVEEEEDV